MLRAAIYGLGRWGQPTGENGVMTQQIVLRGVDLVTKP